MRVAVLFSGGKDSTYAAGWALSQGWEVVLVTMEPEPYSMMFHHPNINWTKLQAEAIGVGQVFVKTTHKNELADLEATLRKLNISGIATGAVASVYQKDRIEAIGDRLGVPVHSPLWHADETKLAEMLESMDIYLVAVAAEGLGKDLLGKPLAELVKRKVKNVHPFLEGGEGETFVVDAPFFKKRIEITGWNVTWDGVRGVAEITDAKLVSRN